MATATKQRSSKSSNVVSRRVRWDDMVHLPNNPINNARIRRIEQHGGFKAEFVGTPELALNDAGAFPDLPDDALVIIDGHHRAVLRERANGNKGPDDVICKVHRGLTRSQVEQRWLAVQDARAHHPNELFVHRVQAGEVKARALMGLIEDSGFWVPPYQPNGDMKGAIRSVIAVEWIYDGGKSEGSKLHRADVVRTLDGLRGMYPHDGSATKSNMLKGLGAFFLRYGDQVDLDRLYKRLPAKYRTVDELLAAAAVFQDALGSTIPRAVGYTIWLAYNGKLGTKANLPEWR